ncbi:hypothetical protein [Flavobacterium sp.]|uniref:hypothetical protein n=1 Tax=Flavobacterium sp. TaxID=239 RepID=UPI00333FEE14
MIAHEYFSPFGTAFVKLEFECDNCHNIIKTYGFGVPPPNFMADKASDSYNSNEDYTVCDHCGKEYNIEVNAGYADGYVEIYEIDDKTLIKITEIDEEYDEYIDEQIETYLYTSNFLNIFDTEIKKLKDLNNLTIGDIELEKTLRRQIYSGSITCLEDYLSTTLINKVLNDDELFKRFVRTFKNIKDRKFSLGEIFEKHEQLKDIVKKELLDIIFHDLAKVKGMYEDTFEIEFPIIEEVAKIVSNRHNMVHRNGKDKDGNEILIDKDSVEKVIEKVEVFIHSVDELIN